jgi:NADH:ubiquinone oxidoreductase subunit 6 (subunit J)
MFHKFNTHFKVNNLFTYRRLFVDLPIFIVWVIIFYNIVKLLYSIYLINHDEFMFEDMSKIYYDQYIHDKAYVKIYDKISEVFLNVYIYLLIHNLISYLFGLLICLFSTVLLLNKNPMYSVICLILVYFSASFLLVSLEINFLAVIVLLVYLGAVVVLFIFVIMMLNIKIQEKTKMLTFVPFVTIIICILFFNYSDFAITFIKINQDFTLNADKILDIPKNVKQNDIDFVLFDYFYFNNFRVSKHHPKSFELFNLFYIDPFFEKMGDYNIHYRPYPYDYKNFINDYLLYTSRQESIFDEKAEQFILTRRFISNSVNFLLNNNYSVENFKILAFILYTHFFLDLIISAFILLVAMLGCISLTLTSDSSVLKKQDSMVQILHKNSILLKKKNK